MTRSGRRCPGANFGDQSGDPHVVLRGDIEGAAFTALPDDVEIRYSTVPTAITQDETGAEVTLLDTATGQLGGYFVSLAPRNSPLPRHSSRLRRCQVPLIHELPPG